MAIFSFSSSNTGLTLKMEGNCIPRLCVLMLTMLTCFATIKATESDISCLRSIKESLEDSSGFLSTWNFSNNSAGFICRFTGVECWRPTKNMVFHIRLPGMGLRGPFPMGIRNCNSLIGLTTTFQDPFLLTYQRFYHSLQLSISPTTLSQVQFHLALPIVL
ncbi:hypothetical protein Lser_V15G43234 [Lactuca serriola]